MSSHDFAISLPITRDRERFGGRRSEKPVHEGPHETDQSMTADPRGMSVICRTCGSNYKGNTYRGSPRAVERATRAELAKHRDNSWWFPNDPGLVDADNPNACVRALV